MWPPSGLRLSPTRATTADLVDSKLVGSISKRLDQASACVCAPRPSWNSMVSRYFVVASSRAVSVGHFCFSFAFWCDSNAVQREHLPVSPYARASRHPKPLSELRLGVANGGRRLPEEAPTLRTAGAAREWFGGETTADPPPSPCRLFPPFALSGARFDLATPLMPPVPLLRRPRRMLFLGLPQSFFQAFKTSLYLVRVCSHSPLFIRECFSHP